MKKKGKAIFYIAAIVLLSHLILVAGCGKNPFLSLLGGHFSVGVGRL